jgi:hypothetical protein
MSQYNIVASADGTARGGNERFLMKNKTVQEALTSLPYNQA